MDPRFIPLAIAVFAWFTFKVIRIGRRDEKLPPGPPTIPILGNIHLLPPKFPFFRFTEWAQEYGGIFSLKVGNGTIIVVSDMAIVKELLDDRSGETSSRPSLYAVDVVTGRNYLVTATSDDHVWRMGRKAIQPLLAPQAVQAHLPIAEAETAQLLHDILHNPEEFYSHIPRSTLSFMTSVVFGKPAPRHDSPEATLFREYIRQLSKIMSPEAAPVDLVPILNGPYIFGFLEQAEQRIHRGLRNETFIEKILDRQEELGLSREMIPYICGVLLDGGAETSSSFLQSLVLCLVRSPASLRKAQEEIDNVVGDERLPVSSDLEALPYVQAVIKETHRFRPVGPTGVPHATINDCRYREYIIPKGAPVFINVWGIFHDPNIFERPDEFWPDRYLLSHDGTKPGLSKNYSIRASLPFGSGKRLCPGIHLANTNLA
ncbi:Cytochrome P450 [Mycena sanguinolenta]|uniref:Cytochrome P450 n=1 Tax=Mycena sanguinolenta TaxID=230812 RepID=A0A8H6XHW2_9AGAR|nr:Cytochrome P450 [Mycena sanguinolenta]